MIDPVDRQLDYMAGQLGRLEEKVEAMIDPRDFGRLEADVASLRAKLVSIEAKMDKLVELASEGKGGIRTLWFAGSVVAVLVGWWIGAKPGH